MRTALVVHAHPDDEVFATGAATIALSDAGWRVVLRVATGGEAAEEPALGETEARQVRSEKLSKSSELLGIAGWSWLGEAGEWVDRAGAGPGTVADAESAILTDAVRRALVEVRPELVLTVGADGLTGHPDHIAIAAAVRAAAGSADGFAGRVLGARLKSAEVAAAHEELTRLVEQVDAEQRTSGSKSTGPTTRPTWPRGHGTREGPRPVGSGGVVGVGSDVRLEEIRSAAEGRRRRALDVYQAGLGTLPLVDVVRGRGRLGDSVVLRAVLDLGGWDRDLFEEIAVNASSRSR